MKLYDRNRNPITVGLRVMVAGSGETDTIKAAHIDHLTAFQAEHEKCIELNHSSEKYAPIELIRLG